MTNYKQMVRSFQTRITCCDDRIKSTLREERTWDHEKIVREMAHRSGLVLGATIAGIPAKELEMVRWTAKEINSFLEEVNA